MAKKNDRDEQESVSNKVLGALPPGMREELDGCGELSLKTHIVQSTAVIRANKKAMKLDPELDNARQRVKDLSEEYTEVSKAKEAIISYALHLLGEKGVVDLDDDEG